MSERKIDIESELVEVPQEVQVLQVEHHLKVEVVAPATSTSDQAYDQRVPVEYR